MNQVDAVLAAEQRFFDSLTASDRHSLDEILADDFTIVDVMTGNVVPKQAFLDFVSSGTVKFEKIERLEADPRFYENTAVIVGRTRMTGRFEGQSFELNSRYTHVFVKHGSWRLAAAQGTQIVD
jgi:ketosteroid isomerase-like protein